MKTLTTYKLMNFDYNHEKEYIAEMINWMTTQRNFGFNVVETSFVPFVANGNVCYTYYVRMEKIEKEHK